MEIPKEVCNLKDRRSDLYEVRAWLFVNLLAAWLNNEPAQTVDVMVYGMQSGSETFSVHPCNESGNARNTVCDATH